MSSEPPPSDRWRINSALRAYSKAETINRAQGFFTAKSRGEPLPDTLPIPPLKGVREGDWMWAGLFAGLGLLLATGWIIGWLVGWVRG